MGTLRCGARLLCAWVLAVVWGSLPVLALASGLDGEALTVARWAVQSGDNAGRPYAVVDKRQARLHLFDGQGRWRASSAVLLGATRGDASAPGIGARTQAGTVGQHERTTPAGRFDSVPGRNLQGEEVVWVDYAAAFAIHRLRPGPAQERRAQRLASSTPNDNRVSLGCVVVPVAFYRQQVQPLLGTRRGVVYVLPESGRLGEGLGGV